MLGLVLGLYMVTGWAGAIKVWKIAKKEREEELFMEWVNTTIRRLREQDGWAYGYDELLFLIPTHTLFHTHEVSNFLYKNKIIENTTDRIELTEEFK